MRTTDFGFDLPQELIAQHPTLVRDASRLMVVRRHSGAIEHRQFRELPSLLKSGDILVHNNSQVLPARLFARNPRTGGQFEILLLEEIAKDDWWVMLKPGKRARVGTRIELLGTVSPLIAQVSEINMDGHRRLQFHGTQDLLSQLRMIGRVPLPPYITRPANEEDCRRYQTIYSSVPGSIAAPTAGLHFTDELLLMLREHRIHSHFVTLHVGIGTFSPVKALEIEHHVMHEERFEVSSEAAQAIGATKLAGGRVVAVGTTSLRVLETVASANHGALVGMQGRTRIFIHPPFRFQVADALLTNFHLPRSTLLMLVSAFATPGREHGRELVLRAYHEAIRQRYRFYSYGDAMLIL